MGQTATVAGAPTPWQLLDVALDVASAAASLLLDRPPGPLQVGTKSTPTDVVTEMDTAAERLIRQRLAELRPGDAVVGEEYGSDASTGSPVRWIVDPLDGSVNYLYGLPGWAVSIAAELAGDVVAAVVAVPTVGDTYTAVKGSGALLNGVPTAVSACTSLDDALLATGFGYDATVRTGQAQAVARLIGRMRDLRRFGAAAADLCLLASGRVDAYFERGLALWDHSAGVLVAREAGATVEVGDRVSGANPALYPAFRALLDEVGA